MVQHYAMDASCHTTTECDPPMGRMIMRSCLSGTTLLLPYADSFTFNVSALIPNLQR